MAINITNLAVYIRERIKIANALIETRQHTAVSDLLVEPNEEILQPLVDAIQETQRTKSLNELTQLKDVDVDLLVGNLLIKRREGGKAAGVVRVFFTEAKDVQFLQGTAFVSTAGLRFEIPVTVTIDAFTMAANREGDLFFVDVNVEADSESEVGNIAIGDIVDIEGGPAGVVQVTNKAKFEDGADRDDNETMLDRAKLAIAVRQLVTKNGISTVLLEAFASIKSLGVVGFADNEMIRDELTGTNMSLGGLNFGDATKLNIGGKVDVYLLGTSTPQKTKKIIGTKEINKLRDRDADDPPGPLNNVLFVSGVDLPIIVLQKIDELDPATGDPTGVTWVDGVDYRYESENEGLTFSPKERSLIRVINSAKIGIDIQITYLTSTLIATVDTFIVGIVNRVVTADVLAKHALPAIVDLVADVRISATSDTTIDDLETEAKAFFEGLSVGADLEVSDLVEKFYAKGVTFVDLDTLKVTVTLVDAKANKTVTVVTSSFKAGLNVGYLAGTITVAKAA